MTGPGHTVEDFGQPEYLDGAQMRFALSDERGLRSAYVGKKAHATLYAAAPDLLEALIEAQRHWHHMIGLSSPPEFHRVNARMAAAIAKATAQ